jgi:hypothetical protein
MKTKQHHDLVKDTEIFGVSLSLLISRANERSVTMPSGLSRSREEHGQRIKHAKSTIECCLFL